MVFASADATVYDGIRPVRSSVIALRRYVDGAVVAARSSGEALVRPAHECHGVPVDFVVRVVYVRTFDALKVGDSYRRSVVFYEEDASVGRCDEEEREYDQLGAHRLLSVRSLKNLFSVER